MIIENNKITLTDGKILNREERAAMVLEKGKINVIVNTTLERFTNNNIKDTFSELILDNDDFEVTSYEVIGGTMKMTGEEESVTDIAKNKIVLNVEGKDLYYELIKEGLKEQYNKRLNNIMTIHDSQLSELEIINNRLQIEKEEMQEKIAILEEKIKELTALKTNTKEEIITENIEEIVKQETAEIIEEEIKEEEIIPTEDTIKEITEDTVQEKCIEVTEETKKESKEEQFTASSIIDLIEKELELEESADKVIPHAVMNKPVVSRSTTPNLHYKASVGSLTKRMNIKHNKKLSLNI